MIEKKTTVLIKGIVRSTIDGARMKTPDRAIQTIRRKIVVTYGVL